MSTNLDGYITKMRNKSITGADLARYVDEGLISKSDRRKITKKSSVIPPILTERQKLRLEVKEKKSLPKLTAEERRQKFLNMTVENEREKEQSRYAICLGCRKKGHLLKNCPYGSVSSSFPSSSFTPSYSNNRYDARNEICFNCGSNEHSLRACPDPRKPGYLPFASCFICKGTGHIARDCPENPNGLYPQGGCCHICLQKTHLVKDCPERTEEDKEEYRKRRQRRDEEENGPRIDGLLSEANTGADELTDMVLYKGDDDNDNGDDDDDDKRHTKKMKKSKKHRKE